MAPKRPTLSMGQVLGGRYRIEAAIGEGGWGSVYRALCREGGYVAVKLLHTRLAERSVSRKRFEREAALLARLEHPNVVRLLDAGHADDGAPYLVFELLHGESLRDFMRRERAVAPARAGGLALEVLAGLDAAHALGIVHRDVKPPNVFLCRDAAGAGVRARLLDFGIAKAIGSEESHHTKLTESGQMLGSPAYMAPEQVRGGEVGPRADLYSMGLVLAELLGGERIVSGESGIDIILSHVADGPHVLPEAVRRSPLGHVVERAIQKAPEARYGSAREMAAAIGAALSQSPHAQAAQPRPVAVAPTGAFVETRDTHGAPAPATATATAHGATATAHGVPWAPGAPLAPAPARARSSSRGRVVAALAVVGVAGAVAAVVLATRGGPGSAPSGSAKGSATGPPSAGAAATATATSSPPAAANTAAARAARVPLRELTPPELERRIVAAGWPIDPKQVLPGESPVLRVDTYSLSRDAEPDMAIVQLYRGATLQVGSVEASMQGTGYLTAREGDRMLAVLVVGDPAATQALLAALR